MALLDIIVHTWPQKIVNQALMSNALRDGSYSTSDGGSSNSCPIDLIIYTLGS